MLPFDMQAKAPKRPRRVMPKDAEAVAAAEAAKQRVVVQVSRDQHLSVFHAVGKILHYKRQQPDDGTSASQQQQQYSAGMSAAAGERRDSDVIDLSDADAALQAQDISSNSRYIQAA